jgi:hypothetical protein
MSWMFDVTVLGVCIKICSRKVHCYSLGQRLGIKAIQKSLLKPYIESISIFQQNHGQEFPGLNIDEIKIQELSAATGYVSDAGACVLLFFYLTIKEQQKNSDKIISNLTEDDGIKQFINMIPDTIGYRAITQRWRGVMKKMYLSHLPNTATLGGTLLKDFRCEHDHPLISSQ